MESRNLTLALVSLLLSFTALDATGQEGRFRLGEVIGLRYVTHSEGDTAQYESHVKNFVYPFYENYAPGVDWVVLKGDRGERIGQYAWLANFETRERRDHYFPQEEGPFPRWEPIEQTWLAETGEDAAEAFGYETEFSGDFVLVGAEQIKQMPWIDLLGIHHLRVRSGEEADFERFVTEEWNPTAHLLGTWVLIYRADRGERTGEYIMVFAFEQRELRDIYYPEPGVMSEAGEYMWGAVEKPWNDMQRFLDDPVSSEYSDFILIR